MSYLNIPAELRELPQWVVWRYEDREGANKPTKVPYAPRAPMRGASVNDPSSWGAFAEANEAAQYFDGIGFVFTENDPYAFVDLDDSKGDQAVYERQHRLFTEFDSYSEISPSGKGLHIIAKGATPRGCKRFGIELYTAKRFATMTGNVYHWRPIMERHNLVTQLFSQLQGLEKDGAYIEGAEQKYPDEQVLDMALKAVNGEKFNKLLIGNWQDLYRSQSEGDIAFIDIIAFYTQNRIQIARIFRASALGQTPKGPYAHRGDRVDYVEHMINRSFDNMGPYVNIEQLKFSLTEQLPTVPTVATATTVDGSDPTQIEMFNNPQKTPVRSVGNVPPGLLGQIATYIFDSAPRAVPEIALAAAIGIMAGVCGRAYNVSGSGLNLYTIVLANTGTGKEHGTHAISRLIASVRTRVPTATSFIGPSKIASDAGLIKFIANRSQCFLSIIGEFGLYMQSISGKGTTSNSREIRRFLMDLYTKSGAGQQLFESAYSDKDNSTGIVNSPSVSLLGDSTAETFYAALDEDMITEGLLPRFLIIEYTGGITPLNELHKNVLIPFNVTDDLAKLCAHAHGLSHNQKVQDVLLNTDATRIFRKLATYCDGRANKSGREALRHLWTRVHLKALKLAALVAVGCNPFDPIINEQVANWAIHLVRTDCNAMVHRFDTGEIGKDSEETKQVQRVTEAIKEYILTEDYYRKYGIDRTLWLDKIIPFQYFQRRLGSNSAFRNDRMGAAHAIRRSLQCLQDGGDIVEIGKMNLTKYGFSGKAFMVSNVKLVTE